MQFFKSQGFKLPTSLINDAQTDTLQKLLLLLKCQNYEHNFAFL